MFPPPESLPKTTQNSRFLSQSICDYTERAVANGRKESHQAWEPHNHDARAGNAGPCRTRRDLGHDGRPVARPAQDGQCGDCRRGLGCGIGLLGIFFAMTSDGYLPRRVLVAMLIGIWAARLAIYLLVDRVLGCPEEGRYRTLREKWGATAQRRLFRFFQIQALAALFFALPVLVIAHHPVARWTAWDWPARSSGA